MWKMECPPPSRIPHTSLVYGYVSNNCFIATVGNTTVALPLKWRVMLWIVTILQNHAMYHAGHGVMGHTFASLVWFYDGLFQHLAQEANQYGSIPEDWSLPAWDRFFIRLRLGIGHNPLALQLSKEQLADEYAKQPMLWSKGLAIIQFEYQVLNLLFDRSLFNHRE